MKDKIFAELKKKYAGQFTLKYMEILADRMAGEVTKDEEIATVVNNVDTYVTHADLQSEGDRRTAEFRDQTKTLQAEIDRLKSEQEKEKPKPAPKPDDQYEQLKAEIEALKTAKTSEKHIEAVHKKLAEKKIPLRYAAGVKVASEADIDTAVEKAEQEFNDARQELVEAGYVADVPKESGGGRSSDEQIDAEIKELSDF